MENNINEYDIAREMGNTFRKLRLNENPLANEKELETTRDLSPEEIEEEKQIFSNEVTPSVEFKSFKVIPQEKNVIIAGNLTDYGIDFYVSKNGTNPVFITAENASIDKEVLTTLNKLLGYQKNLSNRWGEKFQNYE